MGRLVWDKVWFHSVHVVFFGLLSNLLPSTTYPTFNCGETGAEGSSVCLQRQVVRCGSCNARRDAALPSAGQTVDCRRQGNEGLGWASLGLRSWPGDRGQVHYSPPEDAAVHALPPSGKADSWVIRDSFSSGCGALFTCCPGGPAPLHRLRCGLGPDPPGGEEGQASLPPPPARWVGCCPWEVSCLVRLPIPEWEQGLGASVCLS